MNNGAFTIETPGVILAGMKTVLWFLARLLMLAGIGFVFYRTWQLIAFDSLANVFLTLILLMIVLGLFGGATVALLKSFVRK